jgi:hypothetical protein
MKLYHEYVKKPQKSKKITMESENGKGEHSEFFIDGNNTIMIKYFEMDM